MDDGAHEVRFHVLMAATMKTVICNISPCILVDIYHCFKGVVLIIRTASPLKCQSVYIRLRGTISHKTVIFCAHEDHDGSS